MHKPTAVTDRRPQTRSVWGTIEWREFIYLLEHEEKLNILINNIDVNNECS